MLHLHSPLFHQFDDLFFRLEGTVEVDHVISQFIVLFLHQQDENAEKIQVFKHQSLVFCILILVLQQVIGVLRPVHMRENVVADVVAIVPTFVVVEVVDASPTVFVRIFWILSIYKRVL